MIPDERLASDDSPVATPTARAFAIKPLGNRRGRCIVDSGCVLRATGLSVALDGVDGHRQ